MNNETFENYFREASEFLAKYFNFRNADGDRTKYAFDIRTRNEDMPYKSIRLSAWEIAGEIERRTEIDESVVSVLIQKAHTLTIYNPEKFQDKPLPVSEFLAQIYKTESGIESRYFLLRTDNVGKSIEPFQKYLTS